MEKSQNIYYGSQSYSQIPGILKGAKAKKIFLVCGGTYDRLFIKSYLERLGVPIIRFGGFSPNPVYEDVVAGADLFCQESCDFILSIGGGSAIDVAKCVNAFASMEKSEVEYIHRPLREVQYPHLAIPTTAGSGSESTHFAVMYYQGEKKSVSHESLRPDYVILEPDFLKTLPEYQKKSTVLDALCQATESMWSVKSNRESKEYAEKALELILGNLDHYLWEENEKSASQIMLGSNFSGRAINISETTAAHAMSYKLSSTFGIAHGHAVALCLPYVLDYMLKHPERCSDPRGREYLESVYQRLAELWKVHSVSEIPEFLRGLLKRLELGLPMGRATGDVAKELASSVNPQRLANNPVSLCGEMEEIYQKILSENSKFVFKKSSD